jgi:hypothetical protein
MAIHQESVDFISDYAKYADVLEAPTILHQLVGVQLVATALNRNGVVIQNGAVCLSFDLWITLLSGSGAGRSTTVGLAGQILKEAQMGDLERSVRWGSAPIFYQDLAENPTGLFVWGELGERLKMLNDRRFATVKEWLTDRYDNFSMPPAFIYRRTGKSSDTPTIKFTRIPRVNILATSSNDWFFRNIAEEDSAGGFMSRWLILQADGVGRDIPIPKAPDPTLAGPLAERLAEIAQLQGNADLSAILSLYEKWYVSTKRRFNAQPNRALAAAYWNRHRGHILKLAVVFEASRTASLRVSALSWTKAFQLASKIEQSIFRILPTGMNALGYDLQRITDRIKQAGPTGIARNELTRSFQSMKAHERDQHIKTLVESGVISEIPQPTVGRTRTLYVHEDFCQAES